MPPLMVSVCPLHIGELDKWQEKAKVTHLKKFRLSGKKELKKPRSSERKILKINFKPN